jgi:hypothetical protein
MTDPRIEFLKKHLGVTDQVADATVNGGWPDVDSPDDPKNKTKKATKKYKHFVQEVQENYEQGHCYRNAAKCAGDIPGSVVVHGTALKPDGGRIHHAWVEAGGRVIDPTAGYDGSKEHFYNAVGAEAHAKYEPHDAMVNMVRSGHHGPWEAHEQYKKPLAESAGGPLVAYHGTKADFDHFKTPAWFTPDKKMAHGFAGEFADGVRNEHSKIYTVHLDLKNPLKTDDWNVTEHHAFNPAWRSKQIAKGHDGVHFTSEEGEHEYIAFHPHQIHIVAKESAAQDHFEESREDFMAAYGTSQHIDDAIANRSMSGVRRALKNPAFSREHHERLLAATDDPEVRVAAFSSPHMTSDDVSHMVHTSLKDPWTMNKAIHSPLIKEADLKHIAVNSPHDEVRAHAIAKVWDKYAFKASEIEEIKGKYSANHHPKTYRALYEAMDFIPDLKNWEAKSKETRGLEMSDEHVKKMIDSPDEIDHFRVMAFNHAVWRKILTHPEIQHFAANSTSKGVRRAASDVLKFSRSLVEHYGSAVPWASYWHENKLVWVPKTHIIADAKETNEGLSAMKESFVIFEDGMVKQWSPHELADQLGLSRSVHAHYKDAGVAHYPYKDKGGASYERITAVHRFNYHSRPVNDFLIRNFHGQARNWDTHVPETTKHVDHIFDHGPTTTNPINTMSGLKHSPQELIDHVRSLGHEIGDHIYMHLPAYTSTSTRFSTAAAFTQYHPRPGQEPGGDAHMFHIHVPAGHKLIGLESHPDLENGGEHELVLPRDTILKVNTIPSVYRMGNKHMHVWHSEVHGSNRTPLNVPNK